MLPSDAPLTTRARAKINLTLRVLGRRADGYHELESLVAFAGTGDALTLDPDPGLSLTIDGPRGQGLPVDDTNLILRAVRALEAETGKLRTGHFHLVKRLPVASGIGGGSADAAAALRLLARLNGLSPDDPALLRAAAATGADVPVCLASRARIMAGIGERLGPALTLPPLFALLVNPGVPVETAAVFKALGLPSGQRHPPQASLQSEEPRSAMSTGMASQRLEEISSMRAVIPDAAKRRSGIHSGAPAGEVPEWIPGLPAVARDDGAVRCESPTWGISPDRTSLLAALSEAGNDLEAPARRVAPVIDTVLAALRTQPGCRLARMSGSGATCFALFDDRRQSAAAGRALAREQAGWWVKATVIQ
ncbi:4-(cytidine 5'-diphospho)-2-C-methyl-D-erythritol kinase [Bosea sp. (in: a-proteobacteria)]|uniref:4-(cytidine 5'-diphospho)-2-C-methyl-D-erythritol kinase n=1 Tax=Bosea sp. (in: a-proteobacteria) TaxID=1871050 RepID=UPI00356995E3